MVLVSSRASFTSGSPTCSYQARERGDLSSTLMQPNSQLLIKETLSSTRRAHLHMQRWVMSLAGAEVGDGCTAASAGTLNVNASVNAAHRSRGCFFFFT